MGKTIEELFKSKVLSDGQTAEKKYDVRNSKDLPLRSATGAMDVPFKAVQLLRKNLSSRTKETRIEEEVTGLRVISKLASPIIYGTDVIRLSRQSTDMVTAMKDSVNPTDGGNAGVIGNQLNKAKAKGLELAKKIGIEFPEQLIPTKVKANSKFIVGTEPNTMVTLAEIKKDAAGSLVGKLLASNAKGTPKQIANQVLGASINLLKGQVKKKLFGSPKQGAQNLATKSEEQVQYDSYTKYSNTIDTQNEDVETRNDLSSLLRLKEKNELNGTTLNNPPKEDATKTLGNLTTADGLPKKDIFKKLVENNIKNLSGGRLEAQQKLAEKVAKNEDNQKANYYDFATKYSATKDVSVEIQNRNDLSTTLDSAQTLDEKLRKENKPIKYKSIPSKNGKTKFSQKIDSGVPKSLPVRYKIDTKSALINEKLPYQGPTLKMSDNTTLDEYDFIPLKFTSITSGVKVNTVSFLATVTGISETVSPTWDTAKFLGSPFNYYNYSGIERSVSFNFKVYSTNAAEHIAAWQRINFLTGLAYPQGYNKGYMTPPFLKVTIGNLYVNKECFIDSLSYSMDDNGGWETGNADKTKTDFKFGDKDVKLNDYKLPRVIQVDITLKFVESTKNTSAGNLYGFKKLNGNVKIVSNSDISSTQEKTSDLNSTNQPSEGLTTGDGDNKATLQPKTPSNQSLTTNKIPLVENQSVTKTVTSADTKGEFVKAKQLGAAGDTVYIYWNAPDGLYPYGRAAAYDANGKIVTQEINETNKTSAIESLEIDLDNPWKGALYGK